MTNETNPVSPAALAAVGEFEKELTTVKNEIIGPWEVYTAESREALLAALSRVEAAERERSYLKGLVDSIGAVSGCFDEKLLNYPCGIELEHLWGRAIDAITALKDKVPATLTPPTGGRE